MRQIKQSHKTIYTWFDNLPKFTELQRFHYSHEKLQDASIQFSFSKKQHKILISEITVFLFYAQDSQWATKRAKNYFLGQWLRPIGPSFRSMDLALENLILKNIRNFILNWIMIRIKHN